MAGRVRHPIDVKAFDKYVSQAAPEIKTPLEVKQFGYGQSNPTYQLTSATGMRYVLRKKPPGKLLSKAAHQVEREHRIIAALGPTDVPVPRAICLCEDDRVIGTPFYIMEFLDGRIFEDSTMPGVSPEERTAMWRSAAYTLAKFHSVDYKKIGLEKFGHGSKFYNRQLATWTQICAIQEVAVDADTGEPVGPVPHFQELARFFADEVLQPRDRGTLVHGDYKIDNIMFHKTEPRVIGILDWEMSTVGHPLSDLANLIAAWYTSDANVSYFDGNSFKPGATPGLPTPDTIMGWYKEAAGWDPRPEMDWAMAFSVFRAAAICQGIAARYATRQASSEQARTYGKAFRPLGEYAWKLVQGRMEGSSPKTKI